jgi:hypothetical protein
MIIFFRKRVFITFVFWISFSAAYSQSLAKRLSAPPKENHHGLIVAPLFNVSPETRIAAGVSLVTYFRTGKDTIGRPSLIHPFLGYTQNKQFFNENQFILFFRKEHYYSYGDLSFFNYPYRFFGIGNNVNKNYESYEARFVRMRISILKKTIPHTYAGLRVNFDDYRVSNIKPNSQLDTSGVIGRNGGVNSGLGPVFLYDNRDNIFSTHNGSYMELAMIFNSKIIGSQFKYNLLSIDFRQFKSFLGNNVLAFQSYFNFITGDAPFYQLALMGGPRRMRGYYEGRYRDKNIGLIQLEYRSPFISRVGLAAFAGCGVVFHSRNEININNIKPSYGGGLRFRLDRREKLNLRFDAAFGYKSVGYYFILNETF